MSECSGPQLSNTYECQKLGTLGKELPGFHTKLANGKEGELLARWETNESLLASELAGVTKETDYLTLERKNL